jgi:flagellar biogenesis protein FliO
MDFAFQLVSALAVVAALGLLALAARRRAGDTGGPGLQIERNLPLSHQHRLYVVSVEGRRLLVATHPNGCTLLDRLDQTTGARDPARRAEAGA